MVERRVVRIGQRQQGRVEIVDGLRPGEIIVVRGVQRVRPGQVVDPKPIERRGAGRRSPADDAEADQRTDGRKAPAGAWKRLRHRAPQLITPNGF